MRDKILRHSSRHGLWTDDGAAVCWTQEWRFSLASIKKAHIFSNMDVGVVPEKTRVYSLDEPVQDPTHKGYERRNGYRLYLSRPHPEGGTRDVVYTAHGKFAIAAFEHFTRAALQIGTLYHEMSLTLGNLTLSVNMQTGSDPIRCHVPVFNICTLAPDSKLLSGGTLLPSLWQTAEDSGSGIGGQMS